MFNILFTHKMSILLVIIPKKYSFTEVSHVGKLGKLRDKCPMFKLEDYCLLTSRTTVESDRNFNIKP